MRIALVAYYFSETENVVGTARSRCLARLLEERGNDISYFTKGMQISGSGQYKLFWILRVFKSILTGNFDKIYVTCGPFWHLVFIWLASILSQTKLIVDFRDAWSINMRRGYGNLKTSTKKIKIVLAELIERIVYRDCEYFMVCTPGMKEAYGQLFNDDNKILVVLNGYDIGRDDLRVPAKSSGDCEKALTIVCIGKFAEYGKEKAFQILSELKQYIVEHGENSLIINFVGTEREATEKLIQKIGLEKQTVFYPRMPYAEAMKIAAAADMGLCIIRDESIDFGTKIFDYIGLGLPIYDSFDENSNFRNYFRKYIGKRQIEIDMEDIAKFKREVCFREILNKIDGKGKDE